MRWLRGGEQGGEHGAHQRSSFKPALQQHGKGQCPQNQPGVSPGVSTEESPGAMGKTRRQRQLPGSTQHTAQCPRATREATRARKRGDSVSPALSTGRSHVGVDGDGDRVSSLPSPAVPGRQVAARRLPANTFSGSSPCLHHPQSSTHWGQVQNKDGFRDPRKRGETQLLPLLSPQGPQGSRP